MASLQEVLLVQQVRAHGVSEYERIATALQSHPLLTSLNDQPSSSLTAETCKLMYQQVCERESDAEHGVSQSEGAAMIQDVWNKIYPRYIATLKQQLRDDEEQYETLRILTEKTDGKSTEEMDVVVEVPSSTQDSVSEEVRQPPKRQSKAGRRVSSRKAPEQIEVIDQDPPIEEIEDEVVVPDVEMTDVISQDAEAEQDGSNIEGQHVESSDLPRDESDVQPDAEEDQGSPKVEEIIELDIDEEDAEASPLINKDTIEDDAEDEIATAFASSEVRTPSTSHELESAVPVARVTRTRSNTLNTVTSDHATTEEQASPQVTTKKRAGRPSKKQVVREESMANTPEESVSIDEPETAAAIKRFQSTIMPVLGSITSHRYASIFANPVSDRDAPNYSRIVKQPMDLKTIRMQIRSGEIGNVVSFQCAIFRMLCNAVVYNSEDSEVAVMARELFDHVEESVNLYKAADDFADPSDDRTPKRRRRNDN